MNDSGRILKTFLVSCVSLVSLRSAAVGADLAVADDARRIVEEVRSAPDATSQRYEGLLQVFDARGRTATSAGRSTRLDRTDEGEAVLRFTAPLR